MYNVSNSLSDSQSIPSDRDSTNQVEIKPSRDLVRSILTLQCDDRDLLGAYHVGYLSKEYGEGADISDIMPVMGLSNPTTNVRLRRMSGELKAGGLKIPILRRTKTGRYGSHLYFLNENVVTLDDIRAVMESKNINYEQHITRLNEEYLGVLNSDEAVNEEERYLDILNPDEAVNEEERYLDILNPDEAVNEEKRSLELYEDEAESLEDFWANSSDDLSPEDSWNSKQIFKEQENTEIKESELAVDDDLVSNDADNSTQNRFNDTNLSRTVTLGEVLKIIDTVTETLVEQFNNEIAKRDAQIAELETRLAWYQDSQCASTNHTEEILDTVRSSVRSKFGEFSSKQNGRTHN